jgi:ABC-2 type transport system ATP-binding protein
MAFLEASGIVKRFANHLALNDVNISVPENSIYGLLGPNGAGKTTLIRIINKITGPDEGTLMLDGKPLRSSDIMNLKGLSRNDALKRLKYWFEKFEIQPWWDKKVEELSKGMAQKVQFIVTILHEPQLLIFDEPFSGFDPVNATLLKEEILELKQKGATIIFSTHNMASVEELCDHITLINNGKAMIEGRTEQIRRGYRQNLVNIEFSGQREEVEKILNDNFELRNLDVFIQVVNQKEQPSQNQKS